MENKPQVGPWLFPLALRAALGGTVKNLKLNGIGSKPFEFIPLENKNEKEKSLNYIMKYLLTIFLLLKISYTKGQDLPLIKAFAQQNFKCYRVKYFSELKKKVDKKRSKESEVYYLLQGDQVLGFIFFYGQEPNFF
ncbi:hypothetical protein [Pedobacter sp.]|uniref:hypothetical protein n=1 Tax=Pedobacter sp. TaxID=1411316 RepID=UPI0031E11E44